MKRFAVIMTLAFLSLSMWGQAQITTRKFKFNDFTEKTTKIVLTGNLFYDSALKEEISNRWRLSPYEFCTMEEFEEIKTDGSYYFLLTTKGLFKTEQVPGITFLSLVKGGEGARSSIKSMLEVVSIPLCPAEEQNGREFIFLPALIEIMQLHTELSMQYDFNAYLGLARSARYMSQDNAQGKRLVISRTDISESIPAEETERLTKKMEIVEEEEIDRIMMDGTPGTLISYVVTTNQKDRGSYCYKMIINPENKTLFYFKRSKITSFAKAGFLEGDLRRISELMKGSR